MSNEITLDWMKEPYTIIDSEEDRERKKKKRNYTVIDEHSHCGMEVGGPKEIREFWPSRSVRDPEEKVFSVMGMRHFFVNAGRWDKKYLDPNTTPPMTIDDTIFMMDDAGIEKLILLGRDYQNAFPPYNHPYASADYIASLVKQHPDRLVGLGTTNPFQGGKVVANKIKYYVEDLHLHGAGEIYSPTGVHLDDKELCYPIYEACQEYNIPIFIHIGFGGLAGRGYGAGRETGNPAALEQVAYDFPDLKVVQHSHLPPHYLYLTTALCQRHKNFYTQVGYWAKGTILNHDPWIKNFAPGKDWTLYCQKHLPDKVMFGSDYYWGFPQKMTIQWLESIGLTEEFKKKIFETTVKKVYNIK